MTERLSASVVSRHLACHGSANLDQAILGWQPPIEDRTISNAANDGTRLHEILEPIMELTPARLRQMAKVVQYIADLRSSRRFTTVLIEQSFTAHWLLGKPDTKPDLVLATQDEIHIVDFKWGKILVEAKGNTQGLYYAAPCCTRPSSTTTPSSISKERTWASSSVSTSRPTQQQISGSTGLHATSQTPRSSR
jgi:hypothetical protein